MGLEKTSIDQSLILLFFALKARHSLGMDVEDLQQLSLSDYTFDGWALLAAFIFGVVGLWLFRQGGRRENPIVRYVGLTLMIYPYVVTGRFATWFVGFVLCVVAYHFW